MLSRKTVLTVGMAAALALFISATASAQGILPDQRTFFTFSAPVTLPGVTLPAGKYEFKLANSSYRHVVQVFDANGKIITTLFAIPSIRMDVPNDPEIRFMETPADMPPAIQTWWYPGTKTGHEFMYPKQQAQRLAKANTRGVLAGTGSSGDLTRMSGAGAETKVAEQEPAPEAVAGRAQRGEVSTAPARAETKNPDAKVAANAPARTELPHSASALPLIVMLGVASLGFGVISYTFRRRNWI